MKLLVATFALLIGYGVFATLMFVSKTNELAAALDSDAQKMAECRALHAAANGYYQRCMAILEPSIRQQVKMEHALSRCWSEDSK